MSSEWRRDPTTNPRGFGGLMDRLRRIEQQISSLAARAGINNATMTGLMRVLGSIVVEGGNIIIRTGGLIIESVNGRINLQSGGSILLLDKESREVAYLGGFTTNGFGMYLRRLDGSLALLFSDDDGQNEATQRILLADRNGAEIVSESLDGAGLRRPLIPMRFARARYTDWPAVTSSSFERIYEATVHKHNPQAYVTLRHTTDESATAGEARVLVDGTPVGTVPVSFAVNYTTVGPFAVPGGFLSQRSIHVEARRTAGTGNVRVEVTGASGYAA